MNKTSLPKVALCLLLTPAAASEQDSFFEALQALCGSVFEGKMTYPTQGQASFRDKILVATLNDCTDQQISIPFLVGNDRSRTWLIGNNANTLTLKHDHRHADGSPDEVTLYGGSTASNSAKKPNLTRRFPADTYTQSLIPEAASNIWSLTLSDDLGTLTYHLERHNKPRFTAVLSRREQAP